MNKFPDETISRWTKKVTDYLSHSDSGYVADDIKTGGHAWQIAHRVDITFEAYSDRSVVDAHIVTALKKIFPNAVFKDTYTY